MSLVIIVLYFGFLIAVGLVFSRMVQNSDDFFRAGGQGSWWLVGTSAFMAGISSYTFTGNAVGIYTSGWSPLAIYLANITGFVVGGLGLAALYRQMRVVTVAEVLRLRFGKITEQIIASLVVLNNIIWSGVVLYGLSVFSRMIFPGVDPLIITVVVGLVVLVYCMVGGTWAVMANDFVQGLIMISMTILLTVICFVKAGGICGFFEAISSNPVTAREFQFVTPSEPGTFWTARYGLTWILAAFLAQFS